MKNICFYLQIHQPYRLRRYRFFDIGQDHFYFDQALNRMVMQRMAQECYMPMGQVIKDLVDVYGSQNVRLAISVSGTAIEQMKLYTPQVIDMIAELVDAGVVELLGEPYAHSLSSFWCDGVEFERQVEQHRRAVIDTFGFTPKVFMNTDFVYSAEVSGAVRGLGYEAIVADGVDRILAGRSVNKMYGLDDGNCLILKNSEMSNELMHTIYECDYGFNPQTYNDKLLEQHGDQINLFVDLNNFIENEECKESWIAAMGSMLENVAKSDQLNMVKPSDLIKSCDSDQIFDCGQLILGNQTDCAQAMWLENELQRDAFDRLHKLQDLVYRLDVADLNHVWLALQSSEHFDCMSSKWFKYIREHGVQYGYDTPYDAYINYMNVLSDFAMTLNNWVDRRFI